MQYGYRKMRVLLQRESFEVSKKVVNRVYREEGLSLRYRALRRRRAQATRPQRPTATAANQAWSLDFVCDKLSSGEGFGALTIVNVFTREALANQSRKTIACGARPSRCSIDFPAFDVNRTRCF